MTIHINAPEIRQTFHSVLITVNKQKTSYTYLQTALEYKRP